MIAKIVKRNDFAALMYYLVGPGKANEHTDPQVVAGTAFVDFMYADVDVVDNAAAKVIADHIGIPVAVNGAVRGGDVLHIVLSVGPQDGLLAETQWRDIARAYVKGMGIDDLDPDGGSPARWVAVHHGQGANGNDHIHLVVSRRTDDGRQLFIGRDPAGGKVVPDRVLSGRVCREIEKQFGLVPLQTEKNVQRSYTRGEPEIAARRSARLAYEMETSSGGMARPAWEFLPALERDRRIAQHKDATLLRTELARMVRSCAAASPTEAEFVALANQKGLWLRPRFATADSSVITGYAVAFPPRRGEKAVWYGGRHLGEELSLPRLRKNWVTSPELETDATNAWVAALKNRPMDYGVFDNRRGGTVDLYRPARAIQGIAARLSEVPLSDEVWAHQARDMAAFCHQVAIHHPRQRDAWNRIGDRLAYCASLRDRHVNTDRPKMRSRSGWGFATYLMMSAGKRPNPDMAWQVLLVEMLAMIEALSRLKAAHGDAMRAHHLETGARRDLLAIIESTPGITLETTAWAGPISATRIAQTLPGETSRTPNPTGVGRRFLSPESDLSAPASQGIER